MTGNAADAMPLRRRHVLAWLAGTGLLAAARSAPAQAGAAFDHGYGAWDGLLRKHVAWLADNKQTRVDYRGFAADRPALQQVLAGWSALPQAAFDGFKRDQQMAFLVNAYNGFTVELVLSAYPGLKSIKDLGNLLQSPWKKKFFTLLGAQRHLDWIEHEQLRPRYADPRIHAAVNCASIGCPALRPEAFAAARLEAQLEDGMLRFLGDRTRNRFANGQAELNPLFKWYREDFEKGDLGLRSLDDLLARYAAQLADTPAAQAQLRAGKTKIVFLDYDWSLNDTGR